jgi:exopolysaccharide biosynthesis polyprenyl glycosylphosphotransferase
MPLQEASLPASPDVSAGPAVAVRRSVVLTAAAALAIILLDALISSGAFLLAYWVRFKTPVFVWPPGEFLPVDVTNSFRPYLAVLLIVPLVRVLALHYYGLYRLRGEFSYLADAGALLKAVTVGSLVIVFLALLYHGGFQYREYSYSRRVFIFDWFFALVWLGLTRIVIREIQIAYRQAERNVIRMVIVGDGALAEMCIDEIAERPRLGYRVVGVVTASGRSEGTDGLTIAGVPVLGPFDNLPTILRQHGVEEVLITDDRLSPQALFEAIMRCGRTHRINFRVVPNLFNCLPRKTDIAQIGTLPMIKLFQEPLSGPSRILKRTVDIAGALAAIAVSAPAWVVLAWLIKRESPGPVFYRQERVGMDGKIFLMLKFRSMRSDADSEQSVHAHKQAMRANISGQVEDGEDVLFGKVANDERITRIGQWMRRYSIDELPQFLNVLWGEMSLVGPRPPIPYEVEEYADWHRSRFHVKPGITGLWQVSGRNRLRFEQMVQLDIYYIENWSLWMDLKILLRTLPVVMRGDNTN